MGPIIAQSGQMKKTTLDHLGTSSADPIQGTDRPVVMLSKEYETGYCTDLHAHPRAQFLFAQSGTMRARTQLGSWIVPPGYGLLIPGNIEHEVEMFGQVSLRSVYVEPTELPERCPVSYTHLTLPTTPYV